MHNPEPCVKVHLANPDLQFMKPKSANLIARRRLIKPESKLSAKDFKSLEKWQYEVNSRANIFTLTQEETSVHSTTMNPKSYNIREESPKTNGRNHTLAMHPMSSSWYKNFNYDELGVVELDDEEVSPKYNQGLNLNIQKAITTFSPRMNT